MKLSLLGSTGSIGKSTINVVNALNTEKECKVVAMAAGNNVQVLSEQVRALKPDLVSVADDAVRNELLKLLPSELTSRIEILTGSKGLEAVATHPDTDMMVNALVGAIGLVPTVKAVEKGIRVALANKETLVMAGELVMSKAREHSVDILPVDSEHSGIFQILDGRPGNEVRKLILCASGGPFRDRDIGTFKDITPEEALDHPVWKMGPKISIDSATLMNKGLEVIEAHWLFGTPPEAIEILVHPQGTVHSMVEFVDGSVLAQLAVPDMEGPISHAINYPKRLKDVLKPLDLAAVGELTFSRVDTHKFPSLGLAYDALKTGGTAPCTLNAANEEAVDAFLNRKIPFLKIPEIVKEVLSKLPVTAIKDVSDALEADNKARELARKLISE